MATDLERVGDLARNIAGSARRLAHREAVPIPPRLEQLALDSQRLLKRALDCFADTDPGVAREVMVEDDRIDESHDSIIREAIRELGDHPELSSQEVNLILIAKDLERVADHATNIAEDVVLISEARNLKHAVKLRG
jgi:phosphate transport system protein